MSASDRSATIDWTLGPKGPRRGGHQPTPAARRLVLRNRSGRVCRHWRSRSGYYTIRRRHPPATRHSLLRVPRQDHPVLFANLFRWLSPGGRLLFTYATKECTGQDEFDGYREFLGRQLFYSHTTPMQLRGQLEAAGFACESAAYRDIGGDTFLWVTV